MLSFITLRRIQQLVKFSCISLFVGFFSACASTESHRTVESPQVATYNSHYSGPKATLVVGKFANRSGYLQGLFSPDTDKLGNQAKTLLKSHLQQTNRFKIVDRDSSVEAKREAEILGLQQQLKGARYAVTGAVTEFGRKTLGDKQLFGIVGSGKKQIAYAKVTLNIVDVLTSEIVHSVHGAGEYALNSREVLGFGSDASYDSTLNGKVLNLAITEAVNTFVEGVINKSILVESHP